MISHVMYNPTRVYFGKDSLERLKKEVNEYKHILLTYGGGSVKRTGLFDRVVAVLDELGVKYSELGGIKPNPRVSTVVKGRDIIKNSSIDFVLAIGGGSVIDCTKAICASVYFNGHPWTFIKEFIPITKAMSFGTVLTLSATGSEMNSGSVITNEETKEKLAFGSYVTFPKFSILDPINTFTVPKNQTIYGIVDIIAHVFENYFNDQKNNILLDRFAESIIKTMIEVGPKLVNDLENYELRETMMQCGTYALNGTLKFGDWSSHMIEHAISAVYDIPHGGGLAIVIPAWMRFINKQRPEKLVSLGINVFNVNPEGLKDEEIGNKTIDLFVDFLKRIDAPTKLSDYEIDDSKLEEMVDKAYFTALGVYVKLSKDDVREILKDCL